MTKAGSGVDLFSTGNSVYRCNSKTMAKIFALSCILRTWSHTPLLNTVVLSVDLSELGYCTLSQSVGLVTSQPVA